MASGSQWTGNAYSDNLNGGLLNVTMDSSRWNVTDDSNLDNLVLNNTTVDLSHRLSDTGLLNTGVSPTSAAAAHSRCGLILSVTVMVSTTPVTNWGNRDQRR